VGWSSLFLFTQPFLGFCGNGGGLGMKVERCQRNFILLQSFIPPADSWELRAERSTIVARNLSTAGVSMSPVSGLCGLRRHSWGTTPNPEDPLFEQMENLSAVLSISIRFWLGGSWLCFYLWADNKNTAAKVPGVRQLPALIFPCFAGFSFPS